MNNLASFAPQDKYQLIGFCFFVLVQAAAEHFFQKYNDKTNFTRASSLLEFCIFSLAFILVVVVKAPVFFKNIFKSSNTKQGENNDGNKSSGS